MCVNVLLGRLPAPNKVQKDVFFSDPKLGFVDTDEVASYPEYRHMASFPVGRVLRLHVADWHRGPEKVERSSQDLVRLSNTLHYYSVSNERYKAWKRLAEECPELLQDALSTTALRFSNKWFVERAMRTKNWALTLGFRPIEYVHTFRDGVHYDHFGGRVVDTFGCYLAYMLPLVPGPIEVTKGMAAGAAEYKVMIPDGVPYRLYIRCSDSGRNQFAAIYHYNSAVLVWLNEVPHVFPENGFELPDYAELGIICNDYEYDLGYKARYAITVAEHILRNGFVAFR